MTNTDMYTEASANQQTFFHENKTYSTDVILSPNIILH